MVWWFLLGAVLFILGGILSIQPSKTEKRIAALRESAMRQGLHVKLPMSLKFPEGEVKSDAPYYCVNFKDRRPANHFIHIMRKDNGAVPELINPDQYQKVALAALEQIGKGYKAVYVASGLVGISWDEADTDTVPEQLVQVLQHLGKDLSAI